ncbi:hypothetical protein CPB84DRAFT_1850223 [Gymnopilus junonius]|uniref:Uncharacterized protein n=1 Tax=Gymnopilus junonius TaxID=109634 RepID=A0A9P5NES0_GYMJU|nr:hypothetical protein CPB84DRAFT_1850223 [Gymnopilus junonius]
MLSLFGGPQRKAPLLHYLELGSTDGEANVPFLISGTNPECVVTSSLPLGLLQIGWGDLKQAEITGNAVDECIQLLQHAPRLTYLNLVDVVWPQFDQNPVLVSTTHRQLRHLGFSTDQGSSLGDAFFKAVTLPRLEHLSYYPQCPGDLNVEVLDVLIRRSDCPVKSLSFPTVESMGEEQFIHKHRNFNTLSFICSLAAPVTSLPKI